MTIVTRIVGTIVLIALLPLIAVAVAVIFFGWCASTLWRDGAELF